jgi:phosphoglycerol transferase MdoB-like AlkP superfamily enzyme
VGKQISPIRAFVNSLGRTWQSGQKSRPLTAAELERLGEFGFVYDEQSDYPLIKDEIYHSDLPFQSLVNQTDPNMPLNVIVFLSEGISARVIQPYNDQYPGLTPNIADFAGSAMKVDNYYNHTFATYRGLLGQLCSIFPIYAGGQVSEQTDYYCLGNLFEAEGYETYFSFSQQKEKTRLDEVLAKTNIKYIYAQEDLRRLFLAGEAEKRPLALSDQQFFKAIIEHLRALEQRQKTGDKKPFFMGLYNIETHAYYHMSDDGVEYEEQDSYILDTIHNFDNAFGKFWQYFKQSTLFENTVVIFTADHTHFQGKDFVALVNNQPDYKPNFVDRIPMLIYHPGLELPTEFDAKYASSLDLAPTVAHLMKFKNRSNSFLGRSIFERVTNEGLAYGEGTIYLIGSDGVKIQGEYYVKPFNDTDINQMYKVINNINALESQGRIWNRGKN